MALLTDHQKEIIGELESIGAFMFGEFILKSGLISPVYVDMRVIISYPALMRKISEEVFRKIESDKIPMDCVCGVPYAALPIATCVSIDHDIPMVIIRKEIKTYGTGKRIEGKIVKGEKCLVIEDTVSTGASIMDTTQVLRDHGLIVDDVIVILDRNQGAGEMLTKHKLKLRSLFSLPDVLTYLLEKKKIIKSMYDNVNHFLSGKDHKYANEKANNDVTNGVAKVSLEKRLSQLKHPQAKALASIIQRKKSNLCLSADLTDAQEILNLVAKVGAEICLLKLHSDLISNPSAKFFEQLKTYSETLNFMILEDRKFSDIGNTVRFQLMEGTNRISSWANFITVHAVAGAGTFDGLREVCKDKNIGCLVVREMSSKDALCNDANYQSKCYSLATQFDDVVAGFICQKRTPTAGDSFLFLTPGVNIGAKSDNMQQQWREPVDAIKTDGNDIVIVGRGIYGANDSLIAAKKFRQASWTALQE